MVAAAKLADCSYIGQFADTLLLCIGAGDERLGHRCCWDRIRTKES